MFIHTEANRLDSRIQIQNIGLKKQKNSIIHAVFHSYYYSVRRNERALMTKKMKRNAFEDEERVK